MFSLYFLCNYTFNLNLVDGFEFSKVIPMVKNIFILSVVGWLGCGYFCWRPNRYFAVVVILFIAEFMQRAFYFSPYTYYYFLLTYLAVLCAAPLAQVLNVKNRIFSIAVLAVCVYGGVLVAQMCYARVKESLNKPYLPDYVTRNISPCDYVFNGDGLMYNIFGKDPAYYWQLIGQLDVVGEKTGIKPIPNMNELIISLKPKLVFGKNYFDKFVNNFSDGYYIVSYIDFVHRNFLQISSFDFVRNFDFDSYPYY